MLGRGLLIWGSMIVLPFLAGVLRWPWWTVLIAPAMSIAIGVVTVVNEPPNYDMPGFGYYVGGVMAVIAVVAWLGGRGLALLLGGRSSSG